MTGIFDSIIDGVSSLADDAPSWASLGKAGAAGLNSFANYSKGGSLPDHRLKKTDTDTAPALPRQGAALESVDPDTLNSQWRTRLRSFSNMQDTSTMPGAR